MEIITTPGPEGFIKAIEWNHEELKKEMEAKVEAYGSIVYDDNQIREAKKDKADLNKLIKALEDKRKEIKAQCLAPYDTFEKQMKELVAIVQKPVAMIDEQVKAYEARQKEEKLQAINDYIETKDLQGISSAQIINAKWTNATVSLKAIQEEIDKKVEEIAADMAIIKDLEEYQFEAIETYRNTQDVRAAINKAKELQQAAKRKAEWEAQQAQELEARAEQEEPQQEIEEEPEVPVFMDDYLPDFDEIPDARHWATIKAFITESQQQALEEYLQQLGAPHEIL